MVGFQIIDLDLFVPKSGHNRRVCVANFSLCPPQEPPGGVTEWGYKGESDEGPCGRSLGFPP